MVINIGTLRIYFKIQIVTHRTVGGGVDAVLAQVFLKLSAVCGGEGEVAWYGGIGQVRLYNGVGIGFRTVLQHIAIVLPALPFESVKIIIFDNVH